MKLGHTAMLTIPASFIKISMLKKFKKSETRNVWSSVTGLLTISYQFILGMIKQNKKTFLFSLKKSAKTEYFIQTLLAAQYCRISRIS